jgi:hypothetical protein
MRVLVVKSQITDLSKDLDLEESVFKNLGIQVDYFEDGTDEFDDYDYNPRTREFKNKIKSLVYFNGHRKELYHGNYKSYKQQRSCKKSTREDRVLKDTVDINKEINEFNEYMEDLENQRDHEQLEPCYQSLLGDFLPSMPCEDCLSCMYSDTDYATGLYCVHGKRTRGNCISTYQWYRRVR